MPKTVTIYILDWFALIETGTKEGHPYVVQFALSSVPFYVILSCGFLQPETLLLSWDLLGKPICLHMFTR